MSFAGGALRGWFSCRTLAAASLAALSATGGEVGVGEFFMASDPVEVTLVAPLQDLSRRSTRGLEQVATLRFADGSETSARIETYGKSRLSECRMPPLKLTLSPDDDGGTPVDGHGILRLVSPCRGHPVYERPLLLEYLVYRSWSLAADHALGVRLAKVVFEDADGRVPTETRYGFFVEDISDAAKRMDLAWSTADHQSIGLFDAEQAALFALFQFMVGNTDWSVVTGPADERCCHNTAILESDQTSVRWLLPYDFDRAGVVGAPYAVPDHKLEIEDVRQRVYRGFCTHNEALPKAVTHLKRLRPEFEALFLDPALPEERARQAAWKYLEGFYRILETPRKIESNLVRSCRN